MISARSKERAPDGTEHFDETITFENARYISASEATYHFTDDKMHSELPVIFRLGTHLPGEQMREFQEDGNIQQLVAEEPETQFTAWMTSKVRMDPTSSTLTTAKNSPGTRGRRPGQGGSGIMREAAKPSEGSTRSG
jgi:hypothetical protein